MISACTGATSSSTSSSGSAWQEVLAPEQAGGALLSAWSARPGHMLAVGGGLGNGMESLVVWWDGRHLRRLYPFGTETFWWVSGTSDRDAWLVGEFGRITHFDGTVFRDEESGTRATLWGTWSAGPDTAFAVGGSPGLGSNADNDIVLRWDGARWERETLPGAPLGVAHFKVWGTDVDNVYVVGESGTIWHRAGGAWRAESSIAGTLLTQDTLLTVHGCDRSNVWVVGGQTVLHWDGGAWERVEVEPGAGLNGVHCVDEDNALVVGFAGRKLWWRAGAWVDESEHGPTLDLHACVVEDDGNAWAVGGEWIAPVAEGVARECALVRRGSPVPADAWVP